MFTLSARHLLVVLAFVLMGFELYAQDPGFQQRSLTATRLTSNIQVDGRLLEPEWQSASKAGEFRQIQPIEGGQASERTVVRVLYDDTDLYLGVFCYDSEPDRIVAQKLQRDSGAEDDDMFAFILDTYRDQRNAYYFATNPNGIEEDGQVVDNAFGSTNLDWDGVWEVRTDINGEGWSAEFKIPLWNLRFRGAASQAWGINFTRIIKRKTEQVNWTSWSRDNGGFFRISRAGVLNGLQIKQSLNLQIKPYSLGGLQWSDLLEASSDRHDELDAGLDVKLGLSSNLTLDATVNTDFAQVEADVAQINLTRFPLFFPEKREFFLEGANTFHFGQGGFFGPPPILLFFSRRIGISGFNTLVPILAGGRVTGKVGRYDIGLIDILTDESSASPKTHFTVARVNRDVMQRSRIGAIFTNRADFGENHQQTYGVDGDIWLSNPMQLQAFLATTRNEDAALNSNAWKMALDFTKDHWGWFASHISIEEDFDPAVGFVLRRDIHQSQLAFRVSPQPNGRFLRRTDIRSNLTYITNQAGRLQDWTTGVSFFNYLSSGDFINLSFNRIFSRLDRDFSFRPDIVVPTGDYETQSFSASFTSSAKRNYSLSANSSWREFYAGELLNYGLGLGYIPNPHYSFFLNYGRNQIRLPQGDLDTDLFSLRVNVTFNTHLFLNSLIQYNSETNDLSTNLRLNFIHSPGSDLFVVYNESRGRPGARFSDGLPARGREIILKFTRLLKI